MDSPTERQPERPGFTTRFIASAAFTGYAPIASGTVASALAAAIALIPGFMTPAVLMTFAATAFIAGVPLATRMEAYYGHDPAEVTIDEVAGMWITLFLLPASWWVVAAGFILFRVFDIVKPYPAGRFDAMHGGWGIMMDDVVAGVYANLALHILVAVRQFSGL